MAEMKLERYGYRAFNAGIGSCHLVANPGPNDQNPEPLVTEASALAAIAAASPQAPAREGDGMDAYTHEAALWRDHDRRHAALTPREEAPAEGAGDA